MTTPFILAVRPTVADPTIPVVLTISPGGDASAPFIAVERITAPAFDTDLTALITFDLAVNHTVTDQLRRLGYAMLGAHRGTFHSLQTDPEFGLEYDQFVGEVCNVQLRRAIVSHLEWVRPARQQRTTRNIALEREHAGAVANCYTLPSVGMTGNGRATYILAKFTHDPVRHRWMTP